MDCRGTEKHRPVQDAHRRTCRERESQRSVGRKEEESPVLTLWPRLSVQLREALYGALCQHGIVSTRKAIAAIRGVDDDVRTFLSRLDEIAPGAEAVPPSQNSSPRIVPSLESMPSFRCSSCVDAAAKSFLSDNAEISGSCVVDSKSFFVRLVRESTGEFMRWWREAGLTDDVVSAHLLGVSTALVEKSGESTAQHDAAETERDYVMV
eukprot:CAMPEP_0113559778 /NCGR_PEP_ID=MMETSP0015_2-20120614/19078_1 /TAXON_ID=2838 /ORGANISM="Odontella" /LENGTH=207 /DNA_ID=CAMNT_0000461437 /DNA_START=34 /DNA_END=657 /DNA_ORIENTATION=- /assembly_acc=CAM_ASM_000160